MWHRTAVGERISRVSIGTVAHDHVVGHVALGTRSAWAWARVHTLVPLAVLVARTVRVEDTLWPAALVRVSEVLVSARAHANTVVVAAVGVGSARRGVAGVGRWRSCWYKVG